MEDKAMYAQSAFQPIRRPRKVLKKHSERNHLQYAGIPIISTFEQVLGIKTVLMGFGLESNAIHSPNENFPLDIFRKGIEAVVEFHLKY